MTAQEAKDYGFVDEVISANVKKCKKKASAQNAAIVNALTHYQNVPEGLLARFGQSPDIHNQEAVEKQRATVKLLKKE